MSLADKYKTLKVYNSTTGSFSTPAGTNLNRNFQGLIQKSASSNSFNNGKDTSSTSSVLFCSNKEIFTSKDIIEDANGVRYKISNSDAQTDGVTGIEPKAGQHAEYNLTYLQGGV